MGFGPVAQNSIPGISEARPPFEGEGAKAGVGKGVVSGTGEEEKGQVGVGEAAAIGSCVNVLGVEGTCFRKMASSRIFLFRVSVSLVFFYIS